MSMDIAKNRSDKEFANLVEKLNVLLASYQVFYQRLRVYHWNLVDKQFLPFHKLFEEMYQDAQEKIDVIAERIRFWGEKTVCGLEEVREKSFLEDVSEVPVLDGMLKDLIAAIEKIADFEREILDKIDDYYDYGSDDMLASFLRDIEKQEWMLKSSLSNK